MSIAAKMRSDHNKAIEDAAQVELPFTKADETSIPEEVIQSTGDVANVVTLEIKPSIVSVTDTIK